jgi:hypothetical protein
LVAILGLITITAIFSNTIGMSEIPPVVSTPVPKSNTGVHAPPAVPRDGPVQSPEKKSVVVDAGGKLPRLPNGGAGLHLAVTSSDMQVRFVGLLRRNGLPIPTIWDTATVSFPCEAPAASDAVADMAAFAILLGRVRLRCVVQCLPAGHPLSNLDGVQDFLRRLAPAWRVASRKHGAAAQDRTITLVRRVKTFIFAITGGKDGRAKFVEQTWGQRSPIQWYGDVWADELRPIVDLHPKYVKEPFNLLTFKINRIWERVHQDFGAGRYDWYIRLWDDNYFYEENLHEMLGRIDHDRLVMAGKVTWRNMGKVDAVFPFAGGGAGWYLSQRGLKRFGETIAESEEWYVKFRARRDIFLPHGLHNEDVFLTAWLSKINVSFVNIPGVEHVSPGMSNKQRCMTNTVLRDLRWKPDVTVYFDYPSDAPVLRLKEDNSTYGFTKPIVWHYMSPTRLVKLETLLYPERVADFADAKIMKTKSDEVKANKKCYPGVPPTGLPPRGRSMYEPPLPDPPVVDEAA